MSKKKTTVETQSLKESSTVSNTDPNTGISKNPWDRHCSLLSSRRIVDLSTPCYIHEGAEPPRPATDDEHLRILEEELKREPPRPFPESLVPKTFRERIEFYNKRLRGVAMCNLREACFLLVSHSEWHGWMSMETVPDEVEDNRLPTTHPLVRAAFNAADVYRADPTHIRGLRAIQRSGEEVVVLSDFIVWAEQEGLDAFIPRKIKFAVLKKRRPDATANRESQAAAKKNPSTSNTGVSIDQGAANARTARTGQLEPRNKRIVSQWKKLMKGKSLSYRTEAARKVGAMQKPKRSRTTIVRVLTNARAWDELFAE